MNLPFDLRQIRPSEKPVLVLADMHHAPGPSGVDLDYSAVSSALRRCEEALTHARRAGLPVAFVRRVNSAGLFGESKRYPSWIKGFNPRRTDMIFEHVLPSCYSSPEFATMAKYAGGNLVLAGLFTQRTCLATVVDGFNRGQILTFLADASAVTSNSRLNVGAMYDVGRVVSPYSEVTNTATWIRTSSLHGGVKNGA